MATDLVQVSPQELIRRNPGESDADVRRRWKAENERNAAEEAKGERNLRTQENLDRLVMPKKTADKKYGKKTLAKGGSVSKRADGCAQRGKTRGKMV